MTNVSKRKLDAAVVDMLSRQLLEIVAAANTKQRAYSLVMDLLTSAERTMLAKRLAIIIMLDHGSRFEQIENTLKVSPTTVARVWKEQKEGKYDSIVGFCTRGAKRRSVRRTTESKPLADVIEVLLQAGLPPQGKGRWKHVFRDER